MKCFHKTIKMKIDPEIKDKEGGEFFLYKNKNEDSRSLKIFFFFFGQE